MSYYENALKMRPYIEKATVSLSDAEALEVPMLFPSWKAGADYGADQRIEYGGTLYRCIQGHTALAYWTPDKTPALWAAVSLEEWPEWVQPTGAYDAYNIGARVTHKGKKWISDTEGNIWEPGVYGWTEVTEQMTEDHLSP